MTTTQTYEPRVGVVDDPCQCVPPAPADVAAFLGALRASRGDRTKVPVPSPELLEAFNTWLAERRRLDFADLCRYAAANAALPPADGARVVFIGDSITEGWGLYEPETFAAWINRGISGQTTPQMLGRFRADALALKPSVIHLLGGANDIAGNTGPTTLAWIQDNVRSMCELARTAGVQMILGSLTPAAAFAWRPEIESKAPIAAHNAWLMAYAAEVGAIYVDYFSPLSDGAGGMPPELSDDGVHPNARGYAVLTPIAQAAVATALKR